MKRRNIILIGIAFLLIAFQLIPVNRINPPVEEEVSAPAEVKLILKRACYDCHSHETVWPWYSYVAPVSWFLSNHIKGARKKMNFSTWNKYDPEERAELMEESWEEVHEGNMPLGSYLRLHPEAVLSQEDIQTLQNWAEGN